MTEREEKERKAKKEGKKFSTKNKPANQTSKTFKENISKKDCWQNQQSKGEITSDK